MACLMTWLVLCIPPSYATSQSWSYRIDGISASAMTRDGIHIIAGSSSGIYYLFNEYGEVVFQDDLDIEITSADVSRNNMIIGTQSATLILSHSGEKLSHFTSEPVLSVAISENDSCAISGTEINIFIFPSLRSVTEMYVGVPVNYVFVSSDGEKVAAATADGIYVFMTEDTTTFEYYGISSTSSMQFLGDGSLAAGTRDGSLYLIGETADQIGETLGSIIIVEPDGDMIVVGTSSGRVYIYDSSETEKTRFTVDNLVDCSISQNGLIADGNLEILAVVNSGYTLKPWRILAFEYASGDVKWSSIRFLSCEFDSISLS